MTLEALRRIDKAGMYDLLTAFPSQWQAGRAQAREAVRAMPAYPVRSVVVAGMGGSAIGGDLLRGLAEPVASVPMATVRGYTLPAWVGRQTLVIVSSYSGNTEETRSALDQALACEAHVVCVSSGGAVAATAEAKGLPLVRIPGGMPPRAALGASLTALLSIAERFDVLRLPAAAWAEAEATLEALTARYADPEGDHDARRLAAALADHWPIFYAGTGFMEAVATRWRCQVQENAKRLCSSNAYPELNHNEIMGWAGEGSRGVAVVQLRDADDHPAVQRRMDVTRSLLAPRAAAWEDVQSRGESRLARLLSLVVLGDWVSLYLAVERGVDPTPIGLIDALKEALA